jgi:DNA end-binding protein Ku
MPSVSDKELQMATRLVESLTTDWKPNRYKDTYRKELLDLIERKAKGEDIVVEEAAEPQGEKIVDLMAALEASLASAKKGTKAPAPAKKATKATKKTTKKASKATKSTRKKTAA